LSSVLVIGANGQVGGAALGDLAGRGHEVAGTTRRVSGEDEKRLFLDLRLPPREWPDLPLVDAAVICIAVTRITECEADLDGTAVVNLHAPVELARRLCERGAFVLFLSTTGVFDFTRPYRRHDETPSPITTYGRQKAEAETRILELEGKTAVLRLTKIMGSHMPLLKFWSTDLAAGREITAYEDAFIAPIKTSFAARMIHEIITRRVEGISHASGDEDLPYTVLAAELVCAMGAEASLVKTVKGNLPEYPAASAPRHTTLDMSREEKMFGIPAPSSLVTMTETVDLLAHRCTTVAT
jgi:dTDP-4-dehydrorhamnose reductase